MNQLPPKKIILFDGVCNLCNSAVNFIIDRDTQNHFVFAALQSDSGQQLLKDHHLPADFLESILLIEEGRVYHKSTAALRIARHLSSPWPLFYLFTGVPAPLRDAAYQLLAKYRYKIFGKSAACRYPSDDIRSKFL